MITEMSLTGLALIVLAVIAFLLMRVRSGPSKRENQPLLQTMAAAGITGLGAVGVVMIVGAFVSR